MYWKIGIIKQGLWLIKHFL